MSTLVHFQLGAPDGLEGIFWGCDPSGFRDWAYQEEDEFIGTYAVGTLLRLDRIIAEGPGSLTPADADDAKVIDAVFHAFVFQYCDYGPGQKLLNTGAHHYQNLSWFQEAQDEIDARCSPETVSCWRHLMKGRAVGRPPRPYPYNPDYGALLGYWTAEEARGVHRDLRASFPPLDGLVQDRIEGRRVQKLDDPIAAELVYEATAEAVERGTGLVTMIAS